MVELEKLDAIRDALFALTKAANEHDFPTGFENGLLRAAQKNDREKIREVADKYAWGMKQKEKCIAAADALSGVKCTDWGFSSYGRNNRCRVEFYQDEAGELSGKRAASWFENNLFDCLRVLPGIETTENKGSRKRHFVDYGVAQKHNPLGGKRFARYYSVGQVAHCPLTGVCYDEDLLDYIRKGIRSGYTVREILEGLADECGRILERAEDCHGKPETFIENCEATGTEFYEDGTIA